MSPLDSARLAEKVGLIEEHLARVEEGLPGEKNQLVLYTDGADTVVLHLWQAIQVTLDLALVACLQFKAGTPNSYADALVRMNRERSQDLTDRLLRLAEVHEAIAHNYSRLDMVRVYRAAREGPADLRAFLAALRDLLV